jgi:predicted nucleotidyltransferase
MGYILAMNAGDDNVAVEPLGELCRRFHVRRLSLFGSAVSGGFDPDRSDLDLLVEFEPMSPRAYSEAYFGLLAALEALYRRDIDLLTEAALANPYLRRRIEAERQTLFQLP